MPCTMSLAGVVMTDPMCLVGLGMPGPKCLPGEAGIPEGNGYTRG